MQNLTTITTKINEGKYELVKGDFILQIQDDDGQWKLYGKYGRNDDLHHIATYERLEVISKFLSLIEQSNDNFIKVARFMDTDSDNHDTIFLYLLVGGNNKMIIENWQYRDVYIACTPEGCSQYEYSENVDFLNKLVYFFDSILGSWWSPS